MASPHRIVAADGSARVPGIVRASIDLLERQAVVIEVSSGEAALAELERGGVDLLVSAYDLSDMDGVNLAEQASKADSETPVIILADADAPNLDQETRDQSPYHYVNLAEQGAQFTNMLRAVLDGEEISADAVPAMASPFPQLGAVPEVKVDEIGDILRSVLTDVGAMAVVLSDRTGNLLYEWGAVGYMDRDKLTNILSAGFLNMGDVRTLVGGKPRSLHFYDGEDYDIFALTVGLHHFALLLFEGSNGSRAFGAVNRYGGQAVTEMLELMGDVAFEIPEPVAAPKKATTKKKKKKKSKEAEPVVAEEVAAEEYVPPPAPTLEPLPEDADLEALLSGLGSVDTSDTDDLFDPDKLAEMAADARGGEQISWDEAQQMGVISDQ